MLALYGAPGSAFVRKVKIVLLEKRLSYMLATIKRPLISSFAIFK